MNLLRRRRSVTAPPPVPSGVRPPPERPAQLLRRLEFRVVRRLDGFLFGDYRGLFYGPSLDLAEVREYQPGDEVRRIDWNVTARSGRLHVRQYREERELTVWLLVDTSASMNFGTRRTLKRDLAREFAGVAALVVTRHGDKIGVSTFGASSDVVPPRGGRSQALAVLNLLARPARPEQPQPADLASALKAAERTLRRRSLVFVVSDFLEPGSGGWAGALGRLAQRHDVVAVRVSDPAERTLPDVGGLRLRDPETGEELWLDTSDPQVRAAHARLVGERDRALRRALQSAQVDLLDLDTERDPVGPLLRFAAVRRGRRP
ncbi:DUF58 domain-containing protein [Deinococcus metallilatus]|uniref:DUF58 domain-containing protein n=1 Tax=Deinococcus metallilatus TaxID=1211322 RepID=A0AAJ5JYI0_9DEIO|nr:DUF58 domain-containing protein [Deinococcus metallilatus]MBB5294998.1 uncharacterized protein (DUF58 family) [Deinococcus metallilatus]QBY09310.1 DUF58 domain-containing protein [Deinococcus metallilatus]RXJ09315.1 DUF58 domain-containing protein [Deinococcus metallilatus]TLK28837.1 DUF58 domain-containing protein [Deinococcus metallilatus]GMA16931.1 hypothetical protein GCM10025871_32620 [Deinococcus metallilatus]